MHESVHRPFTHTVSLQTVHIVSQQIVSLQMFPHTLSRQTVHVVTLQTVPSDRSLSKPNRSHLLSSNCSLTPYLNRPFTHTVSLQTVHPHGLSPNRSLTRPLSKPFTHTNHTVSLQPFTHTVSLQTVHIFSLQIVPPHLISTDLKSFSVLQHTVLTHCSLNRSLVSPTSCISLSGSSSFTSSRQTAQSDRSLPHCDTSTHRSESLDHSS